MGGATRFLLLSAPLLLHNHHHRRGFPPLLRLARRYGSPRPLLPSPHHHHSQRLAVSPTPPQHHRDRDHHHSTFPTKASHQQFHSQTTAGVYHTSPPSHLWPEWSNLVENLYTGGYFNRQGIDGEDEFAAVGDLPDEFLRAASACLAFARDWPNLLGLLSRRDIEAVVENATPFLFKHGDDSVRRMRSFLISADSNVLDTDNAQTVDLMRFLLSYSSSHIFPSERDNLNNRELVESSVKSLLSELAKLSYSAPEANPSKVVQSQFPDRYGQTPRPLGQNIEMKRGDWICPRCSFMNFARNVKCLECEESRPKRQLTGGEWECPQCDFFNYGRNTACLRCDCKRPGDFSLGTANGRSSFGYSNGGHANKVDVDSRLAASEEKAQRWFTKVSQLDGTSDMSSAIADEDFPEIMPLRKGVNRFVVSTRKTPLERRLTNAQNRRNLGNVGTPEDNDLLTEHANKNLDTKSSRSLDEILGRTSESNYGSFTAGQNAGTESPPISSSSSLQYGQPRGSNSNYVPFVPLPADMFDKKPEDSKMNETEKEVANIYKSDVPNASQQAGAGDKDNDKEEAEKSDRWFKKVAELHDVTDLANAISDEDFPEIMPMRKGENRFVVSKKKDRSLTSPVYKRRMAMEQAGNTNFVPFVPFPPDYFAKKDQQQPNGADLSSSAAVNETSTVSAKPGKPEVNQQDNTRSLNSKPSGQNLYENKTGTVFGAPTGGTTQNIINTQSDSKDSYSSGNSWRENKKEMATSENLNIRESWSGKSLEGSAVKEPDPLDMSEEAKAERWFRRAAQIKDISELSQIPDEDFPSIMPMRKGVNRFVVSKRKTPLERRLTSSQYRRNLPIVSSDPVKGESDGS